RRSSDFLGLLVCSATGLLVSPISWSQHYVWIVPVLAWLTLSPARPAAGRWWAAGAVVLYTLPPMWSAIGAHIRGGSVWFVSADTYVLSAMAFLALLGLMLWLRGRATQALQPARTGSARLVGIERATWG
ncbi:MAG TPA: hypothetical protein VGF87_06565, partial [Acidimicrobiales bacterium]